jgi:hypothetical protein
MKAHLYILVLVTLLQCMPQTLWAQETVTTAEQAKANYQRAKQGIEEMLIGKTPLSYERAIYLLENAWHNDKMAYKDFQNFISSDIANISTIAESNTYELSKKEPRNFDDALQKKRRADEGYFNKAKANYAIYRYMTDSTYYVDINRHTIRSHWPFHYAINDPLGTIDWTNTQTSNLLLNKKGNCFAFVSLFKIYSERLKSEANICTAPGHVYISHKDENGTTYNVEIASKVFPGIGTLSTLTHTTKTAIENDISLRELNLKQSVVLCLVYLAKGYEHKLNLRNDDGFMMSCAETALQYDCLNLNAMLLKAELLENNILTGGKSVTALQTDKTFKEYNNLISRLFTLGYREMPLEMKNILIKGWTRDTVTHLATKNYLPVQKNTGRLVPTRYASLSWGLFEEQIGTKPVERYGRTLFNTKERRVTGFAKEQALYNNYNFDPVLFALNVDPLAHKLPSQSPYSAFGNNPIYYVDPDGALQYPAKDQAGYTKRYPMLTKYLAENVQSDVMKSQIILQGMAKYSEGNLTPTQVEKDFKWGEKTSPTIVFSDGYSSDGETGVLAEYTSHNNTINFSQAFADRVEGILGGKGSQEDKQAALYEFFGTLTHEEVHRGDYIDGVRQKPTDPSGFGGEPGAAFANDVFMSKTVDGERITIGVDIHGNSKELMNIQKQDGRSEVIPTLPTINKQAPGR